MMTLKRVFDLYIDCSIHVAFTVIALFQTTIMQRNLTQNLNLTFFVFCGTILGYNILKYFHVFWCQIYTLEKNFIIVVISFLSLVGTVFFFQKLGTTIQIQFILIGFLVLFYPIIRKFWLIKMLYVSLCLTLVTAVIPLSAGLFDLLYIFQRFLLVFCLLIPLEICDLTSDSKTIITMPKIIGTNNLKRIGYLLMVIFCMMNFTFANLFLSLILGYAIFCSNEHQSKYFSSFWIDVLPIFFYALICYLE